MWCAAQTPQVCAILVVKNYRGRTTGRDARLRRIEDSWILIAENLLEVGKAFHVFQQSLNGTWNQRLVLEDEGLHVQPKVGARLVAHGLPEGGGFFSSQVAVRHTVKGEGADDVDVLEYQRPHLARLHHAVGVGRKHDRLFRSEAAAIGLKLAEKSNDLMPVEV